MRAGETRIKVFSTVTTTTMEARVNDWMRENPDAEIHKIQLDIQTGVHVLVVYEPAGEVNNGKA